jgi:hypothetical protein
LRQTLSQHACIGIRKLHMPVRTGRLLENRNMNSTTRTLFLALAIVAALFSTACGKGGCATTTLTQSGGGSGGAVNTGGTVCGSGTSGGGPVAAFAFFLGTGVETANYSTNGTFTTITSVTPPALAGGVIDDMTSVSGKYVYLPFGDINGVQALALNHATGALTNIMGSPFLLTPTGATADTAVADPAGKFLFVGAEGTGSITSFQINSDGSLTQAPFSPFTDPVRLFSADSLAVDGKSRFLYAGQLNFTTPIDGFTFDSSGTLTEIVGAPFNLQVAQLHADSSGNFLLGVQQIQDAGSATDQHIYVFSIDQTTGVPTPVAGSPFATVNAPFDFAISPNGKFVYLTGSTPGGTVTSIEGYQLDTTTGALTALPGSPFTTLPAASQCKFEPSGGEMFCATASGLSVFLANPSTGALTHGPDLMVSNYPFAVSD